MSHGQGSLEFIDLPALVAGKRGDLYLSASWAYKCSMLPLTDHVPVLGFRYVLKLLKSSLTFYLAYYIEVCAYVLQASGFIILF